MSFYRDLITDVNQIPELTRLLCYYKRMTRVFQVETQRNHQTHPLTNYLVCDAATCFIRKMCTYDKLRIYQSDLVKILNEIKHDDEIVYPKSFTHFAGTQQLEERHMTYLHKMVQYGLNIEGMCVRNGPIVYFPCSCIKLYRYNKSHSYLCGAQTLFIISNLLTHERTHKVLDQEQSELSLVEQENLALCAGILHAYETVYPLLQNIDNMTFGETRFQEVILKHARLK